jgi:hypothetical protein
MREVIIYKLETFNKVILSFCFPVRNTAVRSSPVLSPQVDLRAGYSRQQQPSQFIQMQVSHGSQKGRLVRDCTWFINTGQCWMWKGQNNNEYRNEICTWIKIYSLFHFYLLTRENKWCSKITFSSRWPVRIKLPDRKCTFFCITSVHWRALYPSPIPASYNQRMAVSLGTPIRVILKCC